MDNWNLSILLKKDDDDYYYFDDLPSINKYILPTRERENIIIIKIKF